MYQKSTWSDKNYDFTNQRTTHGDSWEKQIQLLTLALYMKVRMNLQNIQSKHHVIIKWSYLRNNLYWASRKNSTELIELSTINNVSLV